MSEHEVLHCAATFREPFYGSETYQEMELYNAGSQCYCCQYYVELSGELGFDWGACVNSISPRVGLVVFEHFNCEHWKYKKGYDDID